MLFLPKGALPPTKSKAGVARGKSPAGHWMRARASAINPNSDSVSKARHLFNVAKLGYKATQANGADTAAVNGITPAQAWAAQASYYYGIVGPTYTINGVVSEASLIGCSSVEAYQVMCSLNLAQIGSPPQPTPPVTNTTASLPAQTVTETVTPVTLIVESAPGNQTSPVAAILPFYVNVTVPAYATPPGKTENGGWYWDWLPNQLSLTQGQNASVLGDWLGAGAPASGETTITFGISGLGVGMTAQIAQSWSNMPGPLIYTELPVTFTAPEPQGAAIQLTASATATPGSYTVTVTAVYNGVTNYTYLTLVVYSTAENTYAVNAGSIPSGWALALSTPSVTPTYSQSSSGLSALGDITVTIPPNYPAGSYSCSVTLTGPSAPVTATFSVTVKPCATVPTVVPPLFVGCQPNSAYGSVAYLALGVTTLLDGGLNVLGFQLKYPIVQTDSAPIANYSWTGTEYGPAGSAILSGVWVVSASASYTSGYSKPPANSYLVIGTWEATSSDLDGYSNLPWPPEDEVLAAWEAAFGALPQTGKIAFEMVWVDPTTGASSPQATGTAEWEVGTFKGGDVNGYTGPYFQCGSNETPLPPTGSGSYSVQAGIYQYNGYLGTITVTAKAKTIVPNGANLSSPAFPAGLTVTANPSTVTYSTADQGFMPIGYTVTAAPNTVQYYGVVELSCTDGVFTSGYKFPAHLVGGNVLPPPPDFLGISPAPVFGYQITAGIYAVPILLANGGPNTQFVAMLSEQLNPNVSIEFGTGGLVNATATATSITFEIAIPSGPNSLTGQTLSSVGYLPAGYNLTDAPIIANDDTSVTVLSQANPGAMTQIGTAAVIGSNPTVPAGTVTNPGTADVIALITIAGNPAPTGIVAQIEASAGVYSCQTAVVLVNEPGVGFFINVVPTLLTDTGPGTYTAQLVFTNNTSSPLTLTPAYTSSMNGISAVFTASTITLPASAPFVPGTASVNIAITVAVGTDPFGANVEVSTTPSTVTGFTIIQWTATANGMIKVVPALTQFTTAGPGTYSTLITVWNFTPEPLTVGMSSCVTAPGITASYSPASVTVPAASTSEPGSAATEMTVTVASGVTTNNQAICAIATNSTTGAFVQIGWPTL